MKIVADERIAALDESFGRHGQLITVEGRAIDRPLVADADALLTRTVTRVDRDLLEGSRIRFAGTATIGSDHFDTAYLEASGIRWTAAPGCNADATAQYTLAMYLLSCQRLGRDPTAQRFGIVGCGNVGGRLRRLLKALNVETLACDPPLEEQGVSGLCDLDDILDCDVISLHVPLTRAGRWPTHHMFNHDLFRGLSPRALLINACRGDVIEGVALAGWQLHGGAAALDVWPGEPLIDIEILEKAVVATPHIAGYSIDGKYRASAMVYREFCDCFGFDPGRLPEPPADPPPPVLGIKDQSFMQELLKACPVERDDSAMRILLDVSAVRRADAFEALRSNYTLRRDMAL